MGEREFGLGQADEVARLVGRNGQRQRLRVASQYMAASGSPPRQLLMKAEIVS